MDSSGNLTMNMMGYTFKKRQMTTETYKKRCLRSAFLYQV